MIRYFLILFACAIIFSCSGNKTPRGILDKEKMQLVLWDYMKADIFTMDYLSMDSSKKLPVENIKLQKAIFAKYKITREEFYDSYTYYEKHPDEMGMMLDSLIARQRRAPDSFYIRKNRDSLKAQIKHIEPL